MASYIKILLLLFSFASHGQLVEKYKLTNYESVEKVILNVNAGSGNYYIKPTYSNALIYVLADDYRTKLNPHLHSFLEGKNYHTLLNLTSEGERHGVSTTTLSSKLFASTEKSKNTWKVLLSDHKPYDLTLNYTLGNAHMDLSGLMVEQLNVNSESADVVVLYQKGMTNRSAIDTFFIDVDLGDIAVHNVAASNANVIKADVGFGGLTIDFHDRPSKDTEVIASIGAGSLHVTLADKGQPIRVNIQNSPLCRFDFGEDFVKQRDNIFVNRAYLQNSENAITFQVEVALGKIHFVSK